MKSRRSLFSPLKAEGPSTVGDWSILGEREWIRLGRSAMACQFEVLFQSNKRRRLSEVRAALDEIDRYEQLMTVYREDSHLSEINREAALAPVRVHEDLFPVLELSLDLWESTAGAFDITAGPLSECWGFSRREGREPGPEELSEALLRVGSQSLELDPVKRTVWFERRLELNLGGIGKGYALDRVSRPLLDAGFSPLFLHAGHSTILAFGSPEPTGKDPGWLVGIRDPWNPDRDIAQLRLQDQAMSTTGVAEQSFEVNGRTFGHVLDPRTGCPAEQHRLVSVLAPSAAVADGLSTAFFVMTLEEIQYYCGKHPETGVFVLSGGRTRECDQLHCIGLERNSLEVLCKT